MAARVAFFVVLALVVGITVFDIPYQWAEGLTVCSGASCNNSQLSPAEVTQIQQAGLSLGFYSGYGVAVNSVTLLVFVIVSALIFWRRSHDWFGIFTAIMLAGAGFNLTLGGPPPPAIVNYYPALLLPIQLLNLIGTITLFVFFYLFPDGHFVPRWTAWLAVLMVAAQTLTALRPDLLGTNNWIGLVVTLTALFAMIYRYRRVSTTLQRQQTKWVVFGSVIAIAGVVSIIAFSSIASPNDVAPIFGLLIFNIGWYLFVLLIPLSIGMAILRSHLWDIDILIRRTLIYAVLSGLLALVYLGVVVALQAVVTVLTGQQRSELVTVVSTLVIAALFVPLRRRVQAVIDRRFYRRKYDAARTLAAFGASLRDEVELDALTEHLLGAVDESMQPASAALWLVHDSGGQRAETRSPTGQAP